MFLPEVVGRKPELVDADTAAGAGEGAAVAEANQSPSVDDVTPVLLLLLSNPNRLLVAVEDVDPALDL